MTSLPQDVVDALMDEVVVERGPPFWTVAIYLQDRAFGGREEGGWWFDTGSRVDDPREFNDGGSMTDAIPAIFSDEEKAYAYARSVNEWLDRHTNDDGRNRDLSSVCCVGRYVAEVYQGYPPAGYPDRIPRYE